MVSCPLEPRLPCLPPCGQAGRGWAELLAWAGAAGHGRHEGPTLPVCPPQPSQLFTLGPSEHSPVKTPYFDAGVSCADQVGAPG